VSTTQDRHVRIVRIPKCAVLDWFALALGEFPQFLQVPKIDLPPGSKVLAVAEDLFSGSFMFLVSNPAFSEVYPAHVIPDLDPGPTLGHWLRLERKPIPDGATEPIVPAFVVQG
jgi:hypothetical protein